MPEVRTASDLQRNIGEIYKLCETRDTPVYITRNGRADLVVMSADAYERQTLLTQQVREHEKELRDRAIAAYESIQAGRGTPLSEIRSELGLE